MKSTLHRQKLEQLIDGSLGDLQLGEAAKDLLWVGRWKGQFDKPLRLRLVFSDVEITICHEIEPEFSDSFRLECKLGPVDKSRREEVFRKLLEENIHFEPSSCRGFGWDEKSKNVVFSMACPVAAPSRDSLTQVLINLATHARQWREKILATPAR